MTRFDKLNPATHELYIAKANAMEWVGDYVAAARRYGIDNTEESCHYEDIPACVVALVDAMFTARFGDRDEASILPSEWAKLEADALEPAHRLAQHWEVYLACREDGHSHAESERSAKRWVRLYEKNLKKVQSEG